MKALFTPTPAKEKAIVIFSLLSMVFWIYPKAVLASVLQAPGQTTAQIFEIKITDASLLNPNSNNNQTFLTYNTTQQTDPLFTNLQAYLKDHNSPLQGYTSQLLEHDNWKMVLAISQVESNMCVHNLRYNCSGIGGPGHFYAFDNFGGWIDCMSSLLTTRYDGETLDQMNGTYVQPKSPNWGYGSKKILAELTDLEKKSDDQRVVIAQNVLNSNKQLATIAD